MNQDSLEDPCFRTETNRMVTERPMVIEEQDFSKLIACGEMTTGPIERTATHNTVMIQTSKPKYNNNCGSLEQLRVWRAEFIMARKRNI